MLKGCYISIRLHYIPFLKNLFYPTWHEPVLDFTKAFIDHDHFIEGPNVARVVHDVPISSRTVRKVTVVKASFMPAEIHKRAVAIGYQPVAGSKCDDVQQGGDEAQDKCSKNQPAVKVLHSHSRS